MSTPLQDDLVIALREKPMTINQAAQVVMSTPRCVQEALSTLEKKGKVRRNGCRCSPGTAYKFEVVKSVDDGAEHD